MEIIPIIFTCLVILGGLFTGAIVYGAITKKRDIVLAGLFYYSFLPLIGETMGILSVNKPYHTLFICMFIVQLLISSIRKVPFDPTDATLKEYAKRMGLSLIIINLFSAIFIFVVTSDYPPILGIYHSIITLSLVYGVFQRLRGNMS